MAEKNLTVSKNLLKENKVLLRENETLKTRVKILEEKIKILEKALLFLARELEENWEEMGYIAHTKKKIKLILGGKDDENIQD